MKTPETLLIAIAILCQFYLLPLQAEDAIHEKMAAEKIAHDAQGERLRTTFVVALEELESQLINQGELDGVIEVRKVIKSARSNDTAAVSSDERVARLQGLYEQRQEIIAAELEHRIDMIVRAELKRMERKVEQLTKAGKIEKALAKQEALKALQEEAALGFYSRGVDARQTLATLNGTPGEFQVDFDGLRWDLWRTGWTVEGDKLASQRFARPGFNYGHWGNGRGGTAVTGVGDERWTDYEVEFDFHMLSANREFFHAHIPGESRRMYVMLRIQEAHESWNKSDTHYFVGILQDGRWGVSKRIGYGFPGNGWSPNKKGKSISLGGGEGHGPLVGENNRLRLRISGNTITAWMNGKLLGQVEDDDAKANGPPIEFGGWGIHWRYESMGWIRNVEVRDLSQNGDN